MGKTCLLYEQCTLKRTMFRAVALLSNVSLFHVYCLAEPHTLFTVDHDILVLYNRVAGGVEVKPYYEVILYYTSL